MILQGLAFLGDLLWMLYWIPFWYSENMAKWNKGVHSVVVLSVLGECLLKLIILITFTQVSQKDIFNRR